MGRIIGKEDFTQMDDQRSLTSGLTVESNFWANNSRLLLRIAIRGGFLFLACIVLIEMFLFPISYSAASTDVIITPYSELFSENPDNTVLSPCEYPRLYSTSFSGDIQCDDTVNPSYCPYGWTCSIVEDENTNQDTWVCLNNAFKCGDLHYCTNYISTLKQNPTAIPSLLWDVSIGTNEYSVSLSIMTLGLVILLSNWVIFEIWSCLLHDPLEPNAPEDAICAHSLVRVYNSVFPLKGPLQCGLNFIVLFPLFAFLFVSGVVFLASVNPSVEELTNIAAAECFKGPPAMYIMLSSTLGWGIALFVTEMLTIIGIWVLLSLYNIRSLHTIWEPRAFVTIVLLIGIVISIGVTIEIVAVLIQYSSIY